MLQINVLVIPHLGEILLCQFSDFSENCNQKENPFFPTETTALGKVPSIWLFVYLLFL